MHTRKALLAAIFLGVLGFFLLRDFHAVHGGATLTAFYCQPGGVFDCEAVARSSLSSLGTFPVAGLGFLFAVWMIVLTLGLYRGQTRLLRPALISVCLGLLVSFVYVALSWSQLGKLCPLCMSYDLVLLLLTTFLFLSFKSQAPTELKFQDEKTGMWLVTGAVLVLAGGVVLWGLFGAREQLPAEEAALVTGLWKERPRMTVPEDEFDPLLQLNPGEKPVHVVVFSDFQCPYCTNAAEALGKLVKAYPKDVSVRFKHYPLDSSCNASVSTRMHPDACRRAALSQCASEQGAFHLFHDSFFQKQESAWNDEDIRELAARASIQADELLTCATRPETLRKIRLHIAEGESLGIRGTPSIFVNGKKYELQPTLPYFHLIIQLEKEKATP